MLRKILPPVAVAAGAFFLLSNDPASAQIEGDDGDDVLNGADGVADEIEGNAGTDTITGGDETDTAPGDFAGSGDEIDGGAGNDTIDGAGGDAVIVGEDNHCHFGDTEDPACGGNDVIDGGDGDDIIDGDDNFCHAGEDYGKETEKKTVARGMMRMVAELNQAHFGGEARITCLTCHDGAQKPKNP